MEQIAAVYAEAREALDERQRRLVLSAAARRIGRGGIKRVAAAVGVVPETVSRAVADLKAGPVVAGRVRAKGAGRPPVTETAPGVGEALERLVDPATRGDPQSPLRWTDKSTTKVAETLAAQGFGIGPNTVAKLLKASGGQRPSPAGGRGGPGSRAEPARRSGRHAHPAVSLLPSRALGAVAARADPARGLTTAQIAAAFLVPEGTMAKRITRAKGQIREAGARFTLPPAPERSARLGVVLHVLYLMFNEGYTASSGPGLHRTDLSAEAIRLARLLHRLLPGEGVVAGLLALMLLTDARRAARTDAEGALVPGRSGRTSCRPRSPPCTTRRLPPS